MNWLRIEKYVEGEYPDVKVKFIPVMCQQCDRPRVRRVARYTPLTITRTASMSRSITAVSVHLPALRTVRMT